MSQPNSDDQFGGMSMTPETPKQKQYTSVYTMMLVVSFFCLLTATLVLRAEVLLWGGGGGGGG